MIINDYHIIISWEEGVGHSSKRSTQSCVMLNLHISLTDNRKLKPDSNILRIHVPHVTKMKPSSMTAQLRQKRTKFPPSSQVSDSLGFGKHLEHNHHKQRVVNCACAVGTRLNHDLLCAAQNDVVLKHHKITASQSCHSCQFAVKRAERGYQNESDVILCTKQLNNCFIL